MSPATRPNAILEGGPSLLPTEERLRFVADQQASLKLPRGNRYEHFRRSPDTVQHELGVLQVYTWTGSTFVAE